MENMPLRLALMDMYKGSPNEGMRCLREILSEFNGEIQYEEFDVRLKNEVPGMDFDIYISSGGPGSPRSGNGIWEVKWHRLINDLWAYNERSYQPKKYVFFICHSFQMACKHFTLGNISKRKSKSFGIMAVHKSPLAEQDPIFSKLYNPYFAVDSRLYQVIQEDLTVFADHDADILSLEDIHTSYEDEQAIMAVRFSDEFYGTQFHPEADPEGMKIHFKKKKNKKYVVESYGIEAYESMLNHIDDPVRLQMTHEIVIPEFLRLAVKKINLQKTLVEG